MDDAAFKLTLSANGPLHLLRVYFTWSFSINGNLPCGGLVTSLAHEKFPSQPQSSSASATSASANCFFCQYFLK